MHPWYRLAPDRIKVPLWHKEANVTPGHFLHLGQFQNFLLTQNSGCVFKMLALSQRGLWRFIHTFRRCEPFKFRKLKMYFPCIYLSFLLRTWCVHTFLLSCSSTSIQSKWNLEQYSNKNISNIFQILLSISALQLQAYKSKWGVGEQQTMNTEV